MVATRQPEKSARVAVSSMFVIEKPKPQDKIHVVTLEKGIPHSNGEVSILIDRWFILKITKNGIVRTGGLIGANIGLPLVEDKVKVI